MRISAKGRYALAAMIHLGEQPEGQCVPVIHISEQLDISKIYLEQVFSLLKRGGLVSSVKGSQGGYQLTRSPEEITALDIMRATDAAIFEATKATIGSKAPEMDKALDKKIFQPLDQWVEN